MFRDINDVAKKVTAYIKSGVQVIHIVAGSQAGAVEEMLRKVAYKENLSFMGWDSAVGFYPPPLMQEMPEFTGDNRPPVFPVADGRGNVIGYQQDNLFSKPCNNPVQALESVMSFTPAGHNNRYAMENGVKVKKDDTLVSNGAIICMHDLHYDLNAVPALVARIKSGAFRLAFNSAGRCRPLVIVTTNSPMNPDIKPYMREIEMVLPAREQLEEVFDRAKQALIANGSADRAECDEELRYRIVGALHGLTCPEADDIISECLIKHGSFCVEMLATIEAEKGRVFKQSECLTYTSKSEIMAIDNMGGYETLKSWLKERKIAYTPRAEALKLPPPKGMVLIGLPGTGKSRCAQFAALELHLPLVVLDVGSVFSSLVGESESRLRKALAAIDAMDGCVLLIDEADKCLGNAHESTGDSGVTRRIFGKILTWLAEKKSKTFVIMTMNRITGMPPELLRKGRFDEIFFVDTPDYQERRQIFEIHMRLNNVNPNNFSESDWEDILKASEDFVGAEIEQCIGAARFRDAAQNPEGDANFDKDCLVQVMRAVVPIVKLDADNISAIREFGATRARSVSPRTQASEVLNRNEFYRGMAFDDPNHKKTKNSD